MTFRTVLHGTCLLNGKHAPGSHSAAECPFNPERAQRRSARARKIWAARKGGRFSTDPENPVSGPQGGSQESGDGG
jgi:hypothetical protein